MKRFRHLAIGLALLLPASVAFAAQPMTVDLAYDSMMDLVGPEPILNIPVHHNLHVTVGADGAVLERRDRSAGRYSDRSEVRQEGGNRAPDEANLVSWHTGPNGTLIRTENDPQSISTMTVSFLPAGGCHLDVINRLKPGFTEYKYFRISTRKMELFSNYRVLQTACTVR